MRIAPVEAAWRLVAAELPEAPGGPRTAYTAASLLVGDSDGVRLHRTGGWAAYWRDATTPLPAQDCVEVTDRHRFDLASITKVVTAVVIHQLAETDTLALTDPVVAHLPEFAGPGKDGVRLHHLLSHTSGLPAMIQLWHHDLSDPLAAVAGAGLAAPVGTHTYSDLGPMLLRWIAERATGTAWAELVRTRITGPMGMTATGFGPINPADAVATEDSTTALRGHPRGMVRGEVHDENAWLLDGVSGHAGLFSTAADLDRFARGLVGGQLLSAHSWARLTTDELGLEANRPRFMGRLANRPGARAVGHTGFTGTSMVIDVAARAWAILLTNRVHPTRDGLSIQPIRAAVGDALADAIELS
ncbi:serine hydrolase domain-containing protein [Parenemella sanctibonifatiensis]|uniref:Esterase n=1 Tax=Parenemella sanctibonifatiensis TaxID=2016505 RepID=A0A255EKT0_9ACTN|nr:serine hydrolase domain-containing protein [Parenemella sanctibonifatiensis]OYN92094.1 esterase [Parenemella sanctibonifatiensis]